MNETTSSVGLITDVTEAIEKLQEQAADHELLRFAPLFLGKQERSVELEDEFLERFTKLPKAKVADRLVEFLAEIEDAIEETAPEEATVEEEEEMYALV